MGTIKKIIKEITKPCVNDFKGKVGEIKVDRKLNPLLFGRVEHKQINNLILTDENGKTHQIDHIEIRKNGIFCIETKNYIGWIFGSENQEKWTQCLYTGEKHQFINPLKQNRSHIYHMSNVLNKKYKINSLIVMVQNNADKVNLPNVINLDNLKSYLKNFNDGTNYSNEEMEDIYTTLINANTVMKNKEHVNNIRRTQTELKEGICPRCGSELIERDAKYGKFWGCSNFPKCTFIYKNKNNE